MQRVKKPRTKVSNI